jgi:hypothetical protein
MNQFEFEKEMSSFISKLDNAEMAKEAADEVSDVVRAFEREDSFLTQCIPAQTVTRADLQLNTRTGDDTMEKVCFKEPDATALFSTFKGTPYAQQVYGEKFVVKIGKIQSGQYEKHQDELLAWQGIGLLEMVEQNSAYEVMNRQDKIFLDVLRAAVKTGGGYDLGDDGGISRDNLIDLMNALLDTPVSCAMLLMTEKTRNLYMKQKSDVFGDQLSGTITIDGYPGNKMIQMPVITTKKNWLLNDNEIFALAAPEYLGKHYVLEDVRYVVNKVKGLVSWYCEKKFGLILPNGAAVARLRLNGFED